MSDIKIIAIASPPGYGKTTIINWIKAQCFETVPSSKEFLVKNYWELLFTSRPDNVIFLSEFQHIEDIETLIQQFGKDEIFLVQLERQGQLGTYASLHTDIRMPVPNLAIPATTEIAQFFENFRQELAEHGINLIQPESAEPLEAAETTSTE